MEDKKEEKVDVKNEDVIEDIEDIEEIEEISKEDVKKEEVKDESNEKSSVNDETTLEREDKITDSKIDNTLEKTEVINDISALDTKEEKNNKKVLLIVLLSILLVIDIAALVIYLIGIEKVISFIK